jgi:hypothetical protein
MRPYATSVRLHKQWESKRGRPTWPP